MINTLARTLLVSTLIILSGACSHSPVIESVGIRAPAAQNVVDLPSIKELPKTIKQVEDLLRKTKVPADKRDLARTRIQHYLEFLGTDPNSTAGKDTITRLFYSSTSFLFCDNLTDWACLETKPVIQPTMKWRQEIRSDLGEPVKLSRVLDYEFFFTEQYTTPKANRDLQKSLANKLGNIIDQNWKEIYVAIYGIDDVTASMKSVYQGLLNQKKKGAEIYAVFDTEGFAKQTDKGKILLSHQGFQPGDINYTAVKGWSETKMLYQYAGTPELLKELNSNSRTDNETVARLEWPNGGIMHNKFLVFKDETHRAVWTGTANIAKTCMGEESNANMGIYIKDSNVAEVFENEFKEMFSFADKFTDSKKRIFGPDGNAEVPVGKFHKFKTPNTQRYFTYSDDTELRIHFSPTDDGEHRVLIPMLLSAGAGDEIRISMFGNGGLELLRALQFASAKGASVRIAFDNLQVGVPGSWINGKFGTIMDVNPYSKNKSTIEYRRSNWGSGLNHHKTATLTRNVNGKKIAETIVIGSQNWSITGNDESDENMVTIRNVKTGVRAAEAFNEQFDNKIWPASK